MPVIKTKNDLIESWLSIARDKKTNSEQFRAAMENIGLLLFSEAINDAKGLTAKQHIKTPLKKTQVRYLDQKHIYIIPVLRAGLSMLPGIRKLVPEAKVAHVGLYRNENTLEAHWYLDKLPKKITKRSTFFVLEPMIATAGTITQVIQRIVILGSVKIFIISGLISESAKKKLEQKFPMISFHVADIDPILNQNGYIVPGLGDAGDRAFNM
ncbi:MAG: hypothetical protein A3I68_05405 [Candidatus Melainabacteria bacterium RIFCSPLOWO2_02_FULL_35_15]|nr:MAG: hypothetical protein A3F80_07715 [Candidatus Melainabacteria bacterium RIFCSPLOWO2_12_FULL_35_11]OGI12883.1 MAG: hypothetical protein A3I68_05405 [Candidatus Melainabacteria bacterium RIFCSPLOWO2_02_FULL_35_15]